MRNVIMAFIKDLKIEAVKLNLQMASPSADRQKNDVLGTLVDADLDSTYAMTIIRDAIAVLNTIETIEELGVLFKTWNKTRLDIQYDGYTIPKRSEAYAYVFMMRVLKNRHVDLYKKIK